MNETSISETLIDYLIVSAEGFRFERLVQCLLSIREGDMFVPHGGVHDGGADGFLRDIYEDERDPIASVA